MDKKSEIRKRRERLTTDIGQYKAPDFSLTDFATAGRILVVGCREDGLLRELAAKGHQASGTDNDEYYVGQLALAGLDVQLTQAEVLPFADGTFAGIACGGALSAMDERKAIEEWARVLAPGGEVLMSCQGFGHGLLCSMTATDWRTRVYGVRMVINTWVYRLTGRRLPGFLGNALCQSESRLATYYSHHDFTLVKRYVSPRRFMGQPVFIYHRLQKSLPP